MINSFNSQVEITAKITSDPILRIGKIRGSNKMPDQLSFLVSVRSIDNSRIQLPMRMQISPGQLLQNGDLIRVNCKIIKSKERKVAALAIANGDVALLQQPNHLLSMTNSIRSSFRKLIPAGDAGSLMPGLILGDTSLQSEAFTTKMRRVGFSHLTAVSGANFALVAAFVLWLMQFLFKDIRSRLIITGLVLIFFIFLVRLTPSVLRAAVMTTVLLIAKFRGDNSLGIPALGAAIGLLVLLDPFQAIDPGFALSVLATAGILLLAPRLNELLLRRIKWQSLAESISTPVCATIFCTPVIVALSGQFSLITVPANILVSPVIAPITVLGFIAALLSTLLPVLSSFLLAIAYPFAAWIVGVCNAGASFAVLQFSSVRFFMAILFIFAVIIWRRYWSVLILISVLILGQLTYSRMTWPGGDWQVTNCDVGQGDGLVLNLSNHRAIVVDVGPDPVLMDRCLTRLKIDEISLLVLTHFHADHVGGLTGAINKRRVNQVWISNNHQAASAYEKLIKLIDSTQIREVSVGEIFQIGSSKISVLWPEKVSQSFASLPGDGSMINNSSIAVLIEMSALKVFAAGDLEPPVQEIISTSKLMQQVDVYKVCHHGSMYQFFPMLDRLKPSVALISVGKENSYGHPASQTIGEFMRRGIKIMRTDKSGGIAVASPNKIRVTGKDWWQIRWG